MPRRILGTKTDCPNRVILCRNLTESSLLFVVTVVTKTQCKRKKRLHPRTTSMVYFPVQLKDACTLSDATVTWSDTCIMANANSSRNDTLFWTSQICCTQRNSRKDLAPSPLLLALYFQSSVQVLSQGWALRSTKRAARFSDKQKAYLDEKFKIGEQTGHKADPAKVATDMRRAKNEDGARKFTVNEFLSPQQIKSYFSRMAAKLRQGSHEDLDEYDLQAVAEQEAYSSARAHILDECQLIHPITYDTYNLCDMFARKKLAKLSVSMLRTICDHFDMDIENVPQRLKKPYVEFIEKMVRSCSCN